MAPNDFVQGKVAADLQGGVVADGERDDRVDELSLHPAEAFFMDLSGEIAQCTSIHYGERLAQLGALPSVASIGGSYDTQSSSGVADVGGGPWKTVDDVELAALGWSPGSTPAGSTAPSTMFHRRSTKPPTVTKRSPASRLESNEQSLHRTQGGPEPKRAARGLGFALIHPCLD